MFIPQILADMDSVAWRFCELLAFFRDPQYQQKRLGSVCLFSPQAERIKLGGWKFFTTIDSVSEFSCNIKYHIEHDLVSCLHEIQVKDLTVRTLSIEIYYVGEIDHQTVSQLRVSPHQRQSSQERRASRAQYDVRAFFFLESIAHLTNTLKTLAINDLNAGEPDDLDWFFPPRVFPVYQLSGFRKLHPLEISRSVLLGTIMYYDSDLSFRCKDLSSFIKDLVMYEAYSEFVREINLGTEVSFGVSLEAIHAQSRTEETSAAKSYMQVLSEKFQRYGIPVTHVFQ